MPNSESTSTSIFIPITPTPRLFQSISEQYRDLRKGRSVFNGNKLCRENHKPRFISWGYWVLTNNIK